MQHNSGVVRSPKVIDAWIQPWTQAIVDKLPERTLHVFRRYGGGGRLASGIMLEAMVDEMSEAGIDLALVSGGPTFPMSEVIETLNRWPDRFIGVAAVDPTDGVMKAVRELEALVRDNPICALKLEPFYFWREPTDRVFYPLYAKCEELGITLQTQVGGTGPLYPSRSGQPLFIDEVALDFPGLRIVCGHVGTPWVDEMIHIAWKHELVYIDTSARLPKHFEPSFTKFLSSYGQDRCIYASDWPLVEFARPLEQVADLGLSDEVRHKFLVGNAIASFDLGRFGVKSEA